MTNNIDYLVNTGNYRVQLENELSLMLSKIKNAKSEDTISSLFEYHLMHFIKNYFDLDVYFEKEAGKNYLRHKFNGRMDAISNDLIIEYKKPNRLTSLQDKNSAIIQTSEYIAQIKKQTGNELQAILTDGVKLCYIYFKNGKIFNTPFSNIDTNDFDKIIRALISVKNKKFVARNIVSDFSLNSLTSLTQNLATALFDSLTTPTAKAEMLFKEWESLFHLSENDSGKNADIEKRRKALSQIFHCEVDKNNADYKCLFVLQTTYAIIIKLIACKIVSNLAFDKEIVYFSDLSIVGDERLRLFFESLEDGYVFSTGGIRNLLEGDFFSWYTIKNQWTDSIFKAINDITKTLENYSNFSFSNYYAAIDIFKDLYMEIIPSAVRHSLGEYFTPSWLADYVVKKAISKIEVENWKAIDPCCGSGIFIISLINEILGDIDINSLSEKEKSDKLNEIASRIYGIDINPLSVLTARVGYLLAVAPLIVNKRFEIPIYLGDSANIPQKINVNGLECFRYTMSTTKGEISAIFPAEFVRSQTFVEKMSLLQTTVKAEDVSLVYDKILNWIDDKILNIEIKNLIREFSDKLVSLHKNEWDGIWVRIITNFMLVARVANMDLIVGNPPWVKWEFLPKEYADKIKSICLDRRIFSGQSYMGAISLNICALIANVTASTWLNNGGVLAFLMPKTLMTQDFYAGFRNFYTNGSQKRMYLNEVDDWEKAGNPFVDTQEKFLTYYYSHNFADYSKGIPMTLLSKKRGATIHHINSFAKAEDVADYFNTDNGLAVQLDLNRTGFTMLKAKSNNNFNLIIGTCDYKARSGVEFTPAETYFIEPVRSSSNKLTYFFKNLQFQHSKYKSVNQGEFELEKQIVRPVLKSPYLDEFGILNNSNYCIFPYKDNRNSLPIAYININMPYTFDYFIKNRGLILKQSERSKVIMQGEDFYSLSKVGEYTFQKNIVAFRDNTKLVATVVKSQETPWGDLLPYICAKHCPYISMTKKGTAISENEAYYIAGILNTQIVQDYFKATFSGRSYSINLNIKLPIYNESNEYQKRICNLSKEAHENYGNQEKVHELKIRIEKEYLMLCTL